jgi:outer membrane protein assembly factor BamB
MYHDNPSRSGYVPGTPNPQSLSNLWRRTLDGAVYAEPLVLAGRVIVATENDSIYSFDAQTGNVQWKTTVGTPVPLSDLPCGDIDPLGITGTPVYDPATGLVYAVAEVESPTANRAAHILVGVDAMRGQIRVRRAIDPAGTYPQADQERGALALYGGLVYVPFGGLAGDCGEYRGLIVASRDDGSGQLVTFRVPTRRQGGIWTPPGPVLDANGNIYVAVGNGSATSGAWDHTDSVLRLSPALQLEDGFAPVSWPNDNSHDLDLGSMAPVLLADGLIYADGKSGYGYLLQADHLGGVGGQLQTLAVCRAFGGAAVSSQGIYIPCTDGLRQLLLPTISHPAQLQLGWQAPHRIIGSPVIGGNTVYSLDPFGGVLYALDAGSGTTRATIKVGIASRFATPSISGSKVFVGTMTGIVAVSING